MNNITKHIYMNNITKHIYMNNIKKCHIFINYMIILDKKKILVHPYIIYNACLFVIYVALNVPYCLGSSHSFNI